MLDRIILSDNTTLSDLSTSLEGYRTAADTVALVAAEDKIYLGSHFPFNHRYFKVDTANTNASVVGIKYWDGNEFVSVVDVLDETAVAGVPFAQSGWITWFPDKEESWIREDTADRNGALIPNLGQLTIYDLYWIELTVSADLSAGTALKFVGQRFSDDNDLEAEFPDLARSNAKCAFDSAKTDWEEQSIMASRIIVDDLKQRQIAFSKNQILERRELRGASVQKVAEIVYNAFGDDFVDQRIDARREYDSRLNKDIFQFDLNNNARQDFAELGVRQGSLKR